MCAYERAEVVNGGRHALVLLGQASQEIGKPGFHVERVLAYRSQCRVVGRPICGVVALEGEHLAWHCAASHEESCLEEARDTAVAVGERVHVGDGVMEHSGEYE